MAAVDVVDPQTNSQEDNEPSNEELLRNLANDYASYLNVDFSKERKCLEENIEEMLLRLDEFVGLIDMIRSDDTQCLIRSMPDINAKCQELKKIFVKIDNLEVFVKRVRHDVDVMEEKINIAEKELRPKNSFSKVLKPFFKNWGRRNDDLHVMNRKLLTQSRKKRKSENYVQEFPEGISIDAWNSSEEEIENNFERHIDIVDDFEPPKSLHSFQNLSDMSDCDIEIGSSPIADGLNIVDDDEEKQNFRKYEENFSLREKTSNLLPRQRTFRKRLFSICKRDTTLQPIHKTSGTAVNDNEIMKISEFIEKKENDLIVHIKSDDEDAQSSVFVYPTSPIIGKERNIHNEIQQEDKNLNNITDSESSSSSETFNEYSEIYDDDKKENLFSATDEIVINSLESPLKQNVNKSIQWLETLDWKMKTPDKSIEPKEDLHNSDKKQKYVKGGYVERLKKIISREESDVALWKYQLNSSSKMSKDHQKSLTVEIHKIQKEYRFYLAECNRLESEDFIISASNTKEYTSDSFVRKLTIPQKCHVLFAENTVKDLGLKSGSIVRIHSPWQTLSVSSHQEPVILCTHFTEFIFHNVIYKEPSCRNMKCVFEWKCPCLEVSSENHPLIKCPNLMDYNKPSTKSQINLLPCNENSYIEDFTHLVEVQCKNVAEIFCVSSVQKIMHYLTEMTYEERWSLLLMDKKGNICELQLLSPNFIKHDVWRDLLKHGEGYFFKFEKIRIIHRTDKNNSPALFSLINKIQQQYLKICKNEECTNQAICYILGADDGISRVQKIDTCKELYDTPSVSDFLIEIFPDYLKYCRKDIFIKVIYRNNEELWALNESSLCKKKIPVSNKTSMNCPNFVVIHCTPSLMPCGMFGTGCILHIRDVLLANNELLADKYSAVYCFTCLKNPVFENIDRSHVQFLQSFLPTELFNNVQELNIKSEEKQFVKITGKIITVDNVDAYVWPVCSVCSSSYLTETNASRQSYFCESCKHPVLLPDLKMNLEVVMEIISLPTAHVKVKFKQEHIEKLLAIDSLTNFKGCDISCILNNVIGPVICCVVNVARQDSRLHFFLQEI